MDVKINYAAVAIAAAVMFFVGYLWYSVLFQAQWMAYTGVTMDQQMSGTQMAMTFGGSFLAYLVVFYVQSHIHHAFQVNSVKDAALAAFWSWLGFIVTAMFVTNAYQMKSFGLTIVDSSYWLVSMIAGGIVLEKMKKK